MLFLNILIASVHPQNVDLSGEEPQHWSMFKTFPSSSLGAKVKNHWFIMSKFYFLIKNKYCKVISLQLK